MDSVNYFDFVPNEILQIILEFIFSESIRIKIFLLDKRFNELSKKLLETRDIPVQISGNLTSIPDYKYIQITDYASHYAFEEKKNIRKLKIRNFRHNNFVCVSECLESLDIGLTSFDKTSLFLPNLKKLNISYTKINHLDGFKNLKILDISGCNNLQSLGSLKKIKKLIADSVYNVLDLSGIEEIDTLIICRMHYGMEKVRINHLIIRTLDNLDFQNYEFKTIQINALDIRAKFSGFHKNTKVRINYPHWIRGNCIGEMIPEVIIQNSEAF